MNSWKCPEQGSRAAGVFAAALALAISGSLFAQCPPGGFGPDVIVGELTGPSNYTSLGGIEAVAIGTTSCNIGTQELLWVAGSNQHPVIGQNLFRLKDGRFEHIGQAWLKHGFTALQMNACSCGCSAWPNGTRLGVGCSDPYDSFLNGDQDGMGPKWQVNAFNGNFSWPAQNFSSTGNSIYKRLQVAISDIDPTQDGGGMYFVEGQYVSPDDAAAGNQYNNASYRRIAVGGSGANWNFSFAGMPPTQRTKPGIRAWKDTDNSVLEADVQVPLDGLVIVAVKVSPAGGDMWQYEYAVQNLNCDRSIGEFRVPCSAETVVTDIGFHDVPYHSGEPWDGTDWVGQHIGDEIVWSCPQTFEENPNANALRWGTLYNFRFKANTTPNPATLTLGLFKPGTPNTVTADSAGPKFPSNPQFETIALHNFALTQGTLIEGDLPEMVASDDQYFIVESQQINAKQQSNFQIRMTSPVTTVQQMDLTLEVSGGVQPNTKCSVFIRNWALGGWDKLETFKLTGDDQVKTYVNIPNPSNYIRANNRDVRIRLTTMRGNTTIPFDINVDSVEISILR